jgi:hypothetical protein
MAPRSPDDHLLAGKRIGDEHRLSIDACDTAAVVREIDDPRRFRRGG